MIARLDDCTAIVLAGGRGTRFGAGDKLRSDVGGRPLIQRAVLAASECTRIVVVGPSELVADSERARGPGSVEIRQIQESPAGGGPVAAIAAGLELTTTSQVVVLAGDLPFAKGLPAALAVVLADAMTSQSSDGGVEAIVPIDEGGRQQPLAGIYRTEPLRRALRELGDPAGASMRELMALLHVVELTADQLPDRVLLDVDTMSDLRNAQHLVSTTDTPDTGVAMLNKWTTALAHELGIDVDVDIDALLDLARDAAHSVARPAAPISTFLVGFAAAQAGGSATDINEALDKARLLAIRWPSESEPS